MVSPDYFATLGVPLHAGRSFDATDRWGSRRVVILNETAARMLWPGEQAVGRKLQLGTAGLNGEVDGEVVGVVGDVRYRRLEQAAAPEAYLPALQAGYARTTVFLRTSGDPLAVVPALRSAVRAVDDDLPIYLVRTLEEQIGLALSKARFGSLLLTCFAGVALLLAALGVYGVLSQAVAARRREIGVRIALGAAAGQVERLVLGQGLRLALAGALAGLALALALGGGLRGLLFAVPARDPLTLGVVLLLLLVVAFAACLLPARRAARVDPTLVLRAE
jgi:predicted permease